jgi:4-alpha-glucanotransferase
LNELGLLGLRIQRMPVGDEEFGIPADYEYMTVCAPSCHDSSTMRAWWEEDAARRDRYYKDILGCSGPAPDACEPDVAHRILQQHLESPSVWAIFPVQDVLALKDLYAQRPAKEETINNPCNPRHYWRFSKWHT